MMAMHTNCKLRTDQESQVFLAKQDSLDGFPLKLTFRNKIAYLFYRHLFSNIMEVIYRMLHNNVKSHETIVLDITQIRPAKKYSEFQFVGIIVSTWSLISANSLQILYIDKGPHLYCTHGMLNGFVLVLTKLLWVPITFICIARLNNRLLG